MPAIDKYIKYHSISESKLTPDLRRKINGASMISTSKVIQTASDSNEIIYSGDVTGNSTNIINIEGTANNFILSEGQFCEIDIKGFIYYDPVLISEFSFYSFDIIYDCYYSSVSGLIDGTNNIKLVNFQGNTNNQITDIEVYFSIAGTGEVTFNIVSTTGLDMKCRFIGKLNIKDM